VNRADKTAYGKNHEPNELTRQVIQQPLAIFWYPRSSAQSAVFSAVFWMILERRLAGERRFKVRAGARGWGGEKG
jgi:hypothetical protein